MLKSKILISVIFLSILSTFIYGFFVTLTEGRNYGKFSIDHLLLTPNDLSRISEFCENTPRFTYSSADGPRPAIITVNCQLEKTKVLQYLSTNEFSDALTGIYKKGNIEIEIPKNEKQKLDKVTLLEYL